MKYLISVDIEGITGVVDREFSSESGNHHQLACRYMENDLNAVISGLREVEADCEILVRDAHGSKANNLNLINLVDASVLQGWESKQNMFAGLDRSFDGILCVGYHAGGSNLRAVLSHTLSRKIRYLKFNDQIINEAGLFDLYARSMKIPVIFLSGDDQVLSEISSYMDPKIIKVCVKKSLGRTCALSKSLLQARNELKEGARLAAQKLAEGEFIPRGLPNQFKLEISFLDTALTSSIFADLMEILDFDPVYQGVEATTSVIFMEDSLDRLLGRLNLILRLSYGL